MAENPWNNLAQDDLISQIEWSETSNENKESAIYAVQEWHKLLSMAKAMSGGENQEKLTKMSQEYEDMRLFTIEAVKSQSKITIWELSELHNKLKTFISSDNNITMQRAKFRSRFLGHMTQEQLNDFASEKKTYEEIEKELRLTNPDARSDIELYERQSRNLRKDQESKMIRIEGEHSKEYIASIPGKNREYINKVTSNEALINLIEKWAWNPEYKEKIDALIKIHNGSLEQVVSEWLNKTHEAMETWDYTKIWDYIFIYEVAINDTFEIVDEIYTEKIEDLRRSNPEDEKVARLERNQTNLRTYFRNGGWDLTEKLARWESISGDIKHLSSQNNKEDLNNNIVNINIANKNEISKDDLKTPDGKTIKWVTGDEWKKISESWEYYENFITLYSFLEDNNLLWVWKYRQELINATDTVNLDLNDNSLTEWELVLFGRKLITVINVILNEEYNWDIPEEKRLIEDTYTLHWVESELRKFTWAWSDVTNHQTYGFNGTDKVINSLEKMWIVWWTYFHTMRLRDMMDENKSKPE